MTDPAVTFDGPWARTSLLGAGVHRQGEGLGVLVTGGPGIAVTGGRCDGAGVTAGRGRSRAAHRRGLAGPAAVLVMLSPVQPVPVIAQLLMAKVEYGLPAL